MDHIPGHKRNYRSPQMGFSLLQKVMAHLSIIYPDHPDPHGYAEQLVDLMGIDGDLVQTQSSYDYWDETITVMITYADSIKKEGETPLKTLHNFMNNFVGERISTVHILPFFPYSSDEGFSVIDYMEVNPDHGTWDDVCDIANDFYLMADIVMNHCSAQSKWFDNFQKGIAPGKNYFFTADPDADTSMVTRPRTTPLLNPIQTNEGEKHVWCTFSPDQVDLNYANPDVLAEFVKIISYYMDQGSKVFRLDAVGFMWKELGTTCMHLPQTHEIIRLFRSLIEHRDPTAVIITETNVPHHENLSYFGNLDEAHIVYNFSLPPLLVNALVIGNCRHLKDWLVQMPQAQMGTTFLNFIASHDGIGMRPTEGLLRQDEIDQFIELMKDHGGRISMRRTRDGNDKPYEVNIALYDALKGTVKGIDSYQYERFLMAHTIMMALQGVPAFYIHSLVGTENNQEGVEHSGHNRDINRYKWDATDLTKRLNDFQTHHAKVFQCLMRRIELRQQQPAFHPNAPQVTLHLNDNVFGFRRQSLDGSQVIFCIFNVTDEPQEFMPTALHMEDIHSWHDMLSGRDFVFQEVMQTVTLAPYQSMWLASQ